MLRLALIGRKCYRSHGVSGDALLYVNVLQKVYFTVDLPPSECQTAEPARARWPLFSSTECSSHAGNIERSVRDLYDDLVGVLRGQRLDRRAHDADLRPRIMEVDRVRAIVGPHEIHAAEALLWRWRLSQG